MDGNTVWLSVRDGDGEAVFGGGDGGWSDEEEGEGESLSPQKTVRTMGRDGEKKERREGKEEGRRRKATSRDGAHGVQGEGGAMALLRTARTTSDLKAALLALREMDRRGGREEEGGERGPRLDFAAVVSLAHDKLEQYPRSWTPEVAKLYVRCAYRVSLNTVHPCLPCPCLPCPSLSCLCVLCPYFPCLCLLCLCLAVALFASASVVDVSCLYLLLCP